METSFDGSVMNLRVMKRHVVMHKGLFIVIELGPLLHIVSYHNFCPLQSARCGRGSPCKFATTTWAPSITFPSPFHMSHISFITGIPLPFRLLPIQKPL